MVFTKMNCNPTYILCLIVTCFLCSFSSAQNVFVANDFGNCGVGLSDSTGKWLVPPIYTKIDYLQSGYYRILLGSKEGAVDSTGKIIIPAIYDYLRSFTVNLDSQTVRLFQVSNEELSGILNIQNQFIVPLACRYIDVNANGTIIASKKRKRYSIFYLDGKEKIIPQKQKTAPYSIGEHLYVVSRNSFGLVITKRGYYHLRRKLKNIFHLRFYLRKKFGVMNDSLELIIPKEFSNIYYAAGKYKLISVEKKNKTGYYSLTGKQIWAPVYNVDYGFKRTFSYYTYSMSMLNAVGYTAAASNGKYGIIGVNGDTLLPFIYDEISIPYDFGGRTNAVNWLIAKDDKEGIYNPEKREWLFPVEYTSLNAITSFYTPADTFLSNVRMYNYGSDNTEGSLKLFIARKNHKCGIITSAGQEILPFIYNDYSYSSGGYCFRKDSDFVLVSFPKYEHPKKQSSISKENVQEVIVKKAPDDLLFKKITNANGETIFINEQLLTDTAQLGLYRLTDEILTINSQTYENKIHATAIILTPLIPSHDFKGITKSYILHSTNLNYQKYDSVSEFIINYHSYDHRLEPLNIEAKDKYHTYYSIGYSNGIFREDGTWLITPSRYSSSYAKGSNDSLAYFLLNRGKNKIGIIDGNGKLLMDTIWRGIGISKDNYVWVKKKERFFWRRSYYSWNILDTTSGELLLDRKYTSGDYNPFGTAAVIVERPEGDKLYNMSQKKYILDGNVRNIFKLDSTGNYFAVKTCWGHIGIIDGNGKWLADTIYTALIDANNLRRDFVNGYYRNSDYRTWHYNNYCVLSNENDFLIFDGIQGIVTKDQETQHYLLKIALNSLVYDSIKGVMKFCSDCPSYSYSDTNHISTSLNNWQQNLLFDSLFTGENFIADSNYFWHDINCADCLKKNKKQYFQYDWSKNYDRETLHHIVSFSNDSCISVSRTNQEPSYYSHGKSPKDLFFTAMLFNDGIHPILLDSLFYGTDWKAMITSETSLYFETHPNIIGNCHNPNMLPFVMKNRFIITPTGIELYPPGFKEDNHQLFVPITWKKLKPYMRKEIITKLGI
ncbi:hypothetical protein BH09BAC5_BH09BAC5_26440 [soil metagenome]